MRFSFAELQVFKTYEDALKSGWVNMGGDLGYVEVSDSPIPPRWEEYLQFKDSPEKKSVAPQSPEVAAIVRMAKELRAGHGEVVGAPTEDVVREEGSTPSQSTFTIEEFREASRFFGRIGGQKGGKKGGNVTKLRGSEYYSKIAKLSWEKRRSATGT